MATTTPLEGVKTAAEETTTTTTTGEIFEDVVITLKAAVAAVVHFVTATLCTAFELRGALEEVAPILAIGFLTLTEMIAPSISLKAWCLVWRILSFFRD